MNLEIGVVALDRALSLYKSKMRPTLTVIGKTSPFNRHVDILTLLSFYLQPCVLIDNFMKQKPHQLYDEFKEKHDEEWKWLNEGLSSTALCGRYHAHVCPLLY